MADDPAGFRFRLNGTNWAVPIEQTQGVTRRTRSWKWGMGNRLLSFKANDRSDRTYGKAGQLLSCTTDLGQFLFEYDPGGNLVKKTEPNGSCWKYSWNGSGMLRSVTKPDGANVLFTNGLLGRRLSKVA